METGKTKLILQQFAAGLVFLRYYTSFKPLEHHLQAKHMILALNKSCERNHFYRNISHLLELIEILHGKLF